MRRFVSVCQNTVSLPKQAALNSRGLGLESYQWLRTLRGIVLVGWIWAKPTQSSLFCWCTTLKCHCMLVTLLLRSLRNIRIWSGATAALTWFVEGRRVDSLCSQGGLDWIIKTIYRPQWQQQPQATHELIYHPTAHRTEAYFFKTKPRPDGKMSQRHFQRHQYKSLPWCGSWTEVSVVLAGLHREGCTVKTGMLTLSCHCHAVHKVPWRSVTTHSSHLVEHVPVTLRVAVVRWYSPPVICPWYYSHMQELFKSPRFNLYSVVTTCLTVLC